MAAKLEVKKTDDGAFELSVAPNSMKVGETREFDFPDHHVTIKKVKVTTEDEDVEVDDLFELGDDEIENHCDELIREYDAEDICCHYQIVLSSGITPIKNNTPWAASAWNTLRITEYSRPEGWAESNSDFDQGRPCMMIGDDLVVYLQFNNGWQCLGED